MNHTPETRKAPQAQPCPIRQALFAGQELILVPDKHLMAFRWPAPEGHRIDLVTSRGRIVELPLDCFSTMFCLYQAMKNTEKEDSQDFINESKDVIAALSYFKHDWLLLLKRFDQPGNDGEFYALVKDEFFKLTKSSLEINSDGEQFRLSKDLSHLTRIMFLRNWLHLGRKFPSPISHRTMTEMSRLAFMSCEAMLAMVEVMSDACDGTPNHACED